MLRRLPTVIAGLAVVAAALTACATAAPGSPPAGEPSSPGDGGQALDVGAAWLAGGSMIAIVTPGSSTCTPLVEDAVWDEGVLVVTMTERGEVDRVCTDDLVDRGTVVGVPEGMKPGAGTEVQVTLDGAFGQATLADYDGGAVEDYTPSAGWIDEHRFALLTWGSSSCAPVVESASAASPDEVTVTFVRPAADQVCTMDMAPRVAVVTVDGEVSREATVTFLGDPTLPAPAIPIR